MPAEQKPTLNTELVDAQRRIKVQNQVRHARTIKHVRSAKGPEAKIQEAIIGYLEDRGWTVKIMSASLYIYGFPDLWAGHPKYGERWIEVKNPVSYKFTAAQLEFFPKMIACKCPIFILTAANEKNYKRLFGDSNLWIYLGGYSYGE